MRILAVLLLASGCALHEGERINVAGLELEGMMWPVKCGSTTQAQLNGKLKNQLAIVTADDVLRFEDTDISIGQVQVIREHDWASRELAACSR